jgi:hypothetical protein
VSNTTTTTDVAVIDLAFSDAERYALAAFLAGYRGLIGRRTVWGTSRNVGDVIHPACCSRWILMFVGSGADEIPDWWESVQL